MRLRWDCEKVSRCDAFLYDIEMRGKNERPNLYVGYGEGTPDGTYNMETNHIAIAGKNNKHCKWCEFKDRDDLCSKNERLH